MDEQALRERYEPRLLEEREALRRASAQTAEGRRPVALDQSRVGRLLRMDALQDQAMAAAQETRRLARLRTVETALARLDWADAICGGPWRSACPGWRRR